jgi:hypothetical protein
MSSNYSSGKNSIADCDRCGFKFKLSQLKHIYIRLDDTNIKVCKECWEPDQPQNMQGMYTQWMTHKRYVTQDLI